MIRAILSPTTAKKLRTEDVIHYFESYDAMVLFITSMDELLGEETKWSLSQIEVKTLESVKKNLNMVNEAIKAKCN